LFIDEGNGIEKGISVMPRGNLPPLQTSTESVCNMVGCKVEWDIYDWIIN